MSTITLDYTKAGALNGVKHFAKGILLYGAIGAVQYGLIRLNVWHPDTAVTMSISVIVGEVLQAVSKWLRTQTTGTEQYPDGTAIDPATV